MRQRQLFRSMLFNIFFRSLGDLVGDIVVQTEKLLRGESAIFAQLDKTTRQLSRKVLFEELTHLY